MPGTDSVDIFDRLPSFTWTVGGKRLALPVAKVNRTKSNRLVSHVRVYRDGARHDDTGSHPGGWEYTFLAHVESSEEGIIRDFFPRGLMDLEKSFDVHEVGTLVTPFGEQRCRADRLTYTLDRQTGVDAAAVVATWVEDNEDDTTSRSFTLPTARSASKLYLANVVDGAGALGAGSGLFDSLKEAVNAIVGLIEYPGDVVAQLVTQGQIVLDAGGRITNAVASSPDRTLAPFSALLSDPYAGPVLRNLETLVDTELRAAAEQARATKPRTTKRYDRQVSIFDVALDVSQDVAFLMEINASLSGMPGGFYEIPPKTPIQVLAT